MRRAALALLLACGGPEGREIYVQEEALGEPAHDAGGSEGWCCGGRCGVPPDARVMYAGECTCDGIVRRVDGEPPLCLPHAP